MSVDVEKEDSAVIVTVYPPYHHHFSGPASREHCSAAFSRLRIGYGHQPVIKLVGENQQGVDDGQPRRPSDEHVFADSATFKSPEVLEWEQFLLVPAAAGDKK